jgi:hypothetical protein
MSPKTQAIASIIATAVIAAGSVFGFGVQPMRSELSDAQANSELIRSELSICLDKLEKCWRECAR